MFGMVGNMNHSWYWCRNLYTNETWLVDAIRGFSSV